MLNGNPLVDAAALVALLAQAPAARSPVLLDCSFDLADPDAGARAYAQTHLPLALYLHLDRDLSGAKTGHNGRHPLPAPQTFARLAAGCGIEPGRPVVVYDRQGGMFAARAWWLLRWIGHADVAVLDGGLAAWMAAAGPVEAGPPPEIDCAPAAADAPSSHMPTLQADALLRALGRVTLLDARAPERFRGDVEPLDPVAGHIPGALNRPFSMNLGADGRFKPVAQLHAEFAALGVTADRTAQVVHQCGSGVTACHNLLAMEAAGLPGAALYPGSWSEWCADPARPVAAG